MLKCYLTTNAVVFTCLCNLCQRHIVAPGYLVVKTCLICVKKTLNKLTLNFNHINSSHACTIKKCILGRTVFLGGKRVTLITAAPPESKPPNRWRPNLAHVINSPGSAHTPCFVVISWRVASRPRSIFLYSWVRKAQTKQLWSPPIMAQTTHFGDRVCLFYNTVGCSNQHVWWHERGTKILKFVLISFPRYFRSICLNSDTAALQKTNLPTSINLP
jgi:hypothetical protein